MIETMTSLRDSGHLHQNQTPSREKLDMTEQPTNFWRCVWTSEFLDQLSGNAPDEMQTPGFVLLVLRAQGKRVALRWAEGIHRRETITGILSEVTRDIGPDVERIDTVKICLPTRFREHNLLDATDQKRFFGNIHRGIRGIDIVVIDGEVASRRNTEVELELDGGEGKTL